MPLDRDTDTEIVIRLHWGFRVFGSALMLYGIGLTTGGFINGVAGPGTVSDRILVGLILGGVGIFFFLSGVYAASTTTKITFNQPPGHMTMRWRTWQRRWPPFTRTKHISMEEVAQADIDSESGKDMEGHHRTLFQVWLMTKSGEKVMLLHYYPVDRKVAQRLKQRILEFRGGQR